MYTATVTVQVAMHSIYPSLVNANHTGGHAGLEIPNKLIDLPCTGRTDHSYFQCKLQLYGSWPWYHCSLLLMTITIMFHTVSPLRFSISLSSVMLPLKYGTDVSNKSSSTAMPVTAKMITITC